MSVAIESGELVGLIGPNGASKTTFFNCITGYLEPTEGTVYFDDTDITGAESETVAREGMVRIFQHSRPLTTSSADALNRSQAGVSARRSRPVPYQ